MTTQTPTEALAEAFAEVLADAIHGRDTIGEYSARETADAAVEALRAAGWTVVAPGDGKGAVAGPEAAHADLCSCLRCQDERYAAPTGSPSTWVFPGPGMPGWSYACHLCGNKRCPHHADYRFECTRSNEPGQVGSVAP